MNHSHQHVQNSAAVCEFRKTKKIHFRKKTLPFRTVYLTGGEQPAGSVLAVKIVRAAPVFVHCSAMCSDSGSPTPCLRGALQRAVGSSQQFLEGAVKAALQVGVGHHQNALLIPGDQADLLWQSSIQLKSRRGIMHDALHRKLAED